MEIGKTLDVRRPDGFTAWLAENGGREREIWVVVYKKASAKQTVTYEQLVEVALCYGWIDGQMKSIDAERYAQRFTPRRKRSNWTAANRALALRLIEQGRMTEAGRATLPADLAGGP